MHCSFLVHHIVSPVITSACMAVLHDQLFPSFLYRSHANAFLWSVPLRRTAKGAVKWKREGATYAWISRANQLL